MSTAAPEPVRVKFAGPGDSPVDGSPTADVGAQRPAWGQAEPGGGGLGAPVASILETVLSVFKDSSSSGSSACSSRSSSSCSLAPGGLPTIAGAPTTSARGAADGATLAGSETGTRTPAGWRASASGVPPASAVCERSKQSSCQQLAVPLLAASTLSAQGLARASLQLETPLLATVSRHSQAGELARGSKGSITSHHHHHHHHHQNGDAEAGGGAAADGAVKKRTLMGRLSPWICMPNRKAKWITFILFWAVVGGGLAYLLLWGFTKLVDEVIEPTTQLAHDNLKNWQFALVLSCCMIVLPLAFIPPLPFIWVTAMLFNMWVAFGIVQAAVTVSMALGYLVARRWLQRPARRFLDRYKHVKTVLEAVDAAGPFRVALLVRLGPLPFTVENFVMAVPTSLTFVPYIAGSIVGQLPGNLLACYFGKNLKGLSAMMKGESTSPGQIAYNIGGLLLSIGLVVLGFWFARRAMRKIEREQEEARRAKEEADKAAAEGEVGAEGTEAAADGAGCGEAGKELGADGKEQPSGVGAMDGLAGVGSVGLTDVRSGRLQQQPSMADAPSLYPWGGGGGAAVSPAAAATAAAPGTMFLSIGGGGGGGQSAAASGASAWRSATTSSAATHSGSIATITTAHLTTSTSGRQTGSSTSAAAAAAAAAATPSDTASAAAGMPVPTSVAMAAAAGAFSAGNGLFASGFAPASPGSNMPSRELVASPLNHRRVSELRINRGAAASGGGGGRQTPNNSAGGAAAGAGGFGSLPGSPRMPTQRTHSVASVGGVLLAMEDGEIDIDCEELDPFGLAAGADPDHPGHALSREYTQRTSIDSDLGNMQSTASMSGSARRQQAYSIRQNALYDGGGSTAGGTTGSECEGDNGGDGGGGGGDGRGGGSGSGRGRDQTAPLSLSPGVSCQLRSGVVSGGGYGAGGTGGGGYEASGLARGGSVSSLLQVAPRVASSRDLCVRRAALVDCAELSEQPAPAPPPRGGSGLDGGGVSGVRSTRPSSSRRNSALQSGSGWSAVGAVGNAAVAAAQYEELVVPPSPLRTSRRTASVVAGAGGPGGAPRRLSYCGRISESGTYGDAAAAAAAGAAAAAAAAASASNGGERFTPASGSAARASNGATQDVCFAGFGRSVGGCGGSASPLGVPDQGPSSGGTWSRPAAGGPGEPTQQQLQLQLQLQLSQLPQQKQARGSHEDSLPGTPTRRSPLGPAAAAAVRSGAVVRPTGA